MADEEQRAGERLDRLLNPLAAHQVQVVGRFVEYEHVERVVHELAQAQAALLAARQRAHDLELVLARKAERAQPVAGGLHGNVLIVDERIDEVPALVCKVHLLGQVGRAQALAFFDRALIGSLLAQDDAQKGGLARAVVAQDGDTLAVAHIKCYIL